MGVIYRVCKLEQLDMNFSKLLNNGRCPRRLPGAFMYHSYRMGLVAAAEVKQIRVLTDIINVVSEKKNLPR